MNPFKKYETDATMEKEGVPIEYDGMTFMCRRAGGANRAYRAAVSVFLIENPDIRDKLNSKDDEEQLEAQNELELNVVCKAVLLGWSGVEGRDDQPLPFTVENAIDLFRSCSEVWNVVRVMSQSRDSFRRTQVENVGAALGNSSDGIENTAQT